MKFVKKSMLERCPICRARLKQQDTCRRCGADLSRLLVLSQEAYACYINSINLLSQGHVKAAHRAAQRSMQLKAEPLYKVWLSFIEDRMYSSNKGAEFESYRVEVTDKQDIISG